MKRLFKKAILVVTLVEVLLLTLALFWCGDANCWSGASDDQCSSLICSIFANHNGSSKGESSTHSDCSCVCHIPTLMHHTTDIGYYPPVLTAGTNVSVSSLSAPPRPIYHPPLAS
jgi:hypothetical protein